MPEPGPCASHHASGRAGAARIEQRAWVSKSSSRASKQATLRPHIDVRKSKATRTHLAAFLLAFATTTPTTHHSPFSLDRAMLRNVLARSAPRGWQAARFSTASAIATATTTAAPRSMSLARLAAPTALKGQQRFYASTPNAPVGSPEFDPNVSSLPSTALPPLTHSFTHSTTSPGRNRHGQARAPRPRQGLQRRHSRRGQHQLWFRRRALEPLLPP